MSWQGQNLDEWRGKENATNAALLGELDASESAGTARVAGSHIMARLDELANLTVHAVNEFELHMASEYARMHKELSDAAWEWVGAGKPLRRPTEATEQIESQADGLPAEPEVKVGLS